MKRISIIVLCHNNRGISNCINTILSQMISGDELIIVDDHSDINFIKKELSEYAHNTDIYIYNVHKKRGNRAHNRNSGAALSKNEVLLFLDGDMVLSHGSLQAFRAAHDMPGYVAFLGNAHGMRFSEEHMTLHLGHSDYQKIVQTEGGIQKLVENPALEDWRIHFFRQANLEPYFWIYYYTCICSVTRDAFFQIGGFDEALVTWGSEDIDFGYCLSHCGKIGYVSNAHAVHLPHPRNLWDEQLFDRDNTRYLLDKHRIWPFEGILSFEFSAEVYQHIDRMLNEIASWELPRITPKKTADTLWINVPSKLNVHNTVVWYNHMMEETSTALLGISVPCCDKRFETAFVTTNIFSYPMAMTARILQECMRVSRKVILVPSPINRRKTWEWEYLLQAGEMPRTYYTSSDTMEYQFIPLQKGCYQVISSQVTERINVSRSHCPVYVSAESRKNWHQNIANLQSGIVLISFLENDIYEVQTKLENSLGVQFEQSYHYPVNQNNDISLTRDLPYSLHSSKASILFLVHYSDSFVTESLAQWLVNRATPDFILDISGKLNQLSLN